MRVNICDLNMCTGPGQCTYGPGVGMERPFKYSCLAGRRYSLQPTGGTRGDRHAACLGPCRRPRGKITDLQNARIDCKTLPTSHLHLTVKEIQEPSIPWVMYSVGRETHRMTESCNQWHCDVSAKEGPTAATLSSSGVQKMCLMLMYSAVYSVYPCCDY